MSAHKIATVVIQIFLCLLFVSSEAQVVTGRIVNEENAPVPYATIFVPEKQKGTISNSKGNFRIQLSHGTFHFIIRSMGYSQIIKEVTIQSDSLFLTITMEHQEFEIKEVKVFPGDEDPAYFIVRKAMAKAAYYREKIKHYEAELYLKSNFTFTNIPKFYQKRMEIDGKKMDDVLQEDRTYVIESKSKITYDYPEKYKQEVLSKQTSLIGFDEPPVMGLITSNFYESRPNQVISPLAPMALKHYNYRYEGFITSEDYDVFKIKVEPKRKSDELVTGHMYIVDKLWYIYSIDFKTRIEFFRYRIKQQYENLGNENWLPVSHLIEGNFSILGLRGNFYYGASLKYENIEENFPAEIQEQKDTAALKQELSHESGEKEQELRKEVRLLTAKEKLTNQDVRKIGRLNRKILKEQYKDTTVISPYPNSYELKDEIDTVITDQSHWDTVRTIPLTPAEIESYEITDSLRIQLEAEPDSSVASDKKKTFLKKLIAGQNDFCPDSLVRFGYDGLISLENIDFNAVDGYKFRQQFQLLFTPDSGKSIAIDPAVGYAFNRKALFWTVQTHFDLWQRNRIEIDFGKLSRDFKTNGINPALNSISTWFFARNDMKLYETSFATLHVSQLLFKNFDLHSTIEYNHFFPLKNNHTYKLSDEKNYTPNVPAGLTKKSESLVQQKSFSFEVLANFRKYQKKPWLPKSNYLFISDFYNISLSYKQGISNLFSSVSDFNRLDINVLQQVNLSPAAGIEWQMNLGTFIGSKKLHFSQFKHFQTADIPVSFRAFSNTFQLINDYRYSTADSYLSLGAELRQEYFLLRYLSLVNRKTWSESFHFNYLTTSSLHHHWETGYSLNNLFFVGNIGVFAGFSEFNFEQIEIKVSLAGL